jgi:pyridoxal phosphate enzyme (YggS family)
MQKDSLYERLNVLEDRIQNACDRAGRERSEVHLLPVSKTRSPDVIAAATDCGLNVFGENRIQEAMAKIPRCPGFLQWHLIGHLQTNKARHAARIFDMAHSVDSERVMDALENACAACGKVMPILLEVNVAGEGSKFGMMPEEVVSVVERADGLPHVEPVGLMTIPPFANDAEKVRKYFRALRILRDKCEEQTGIRLQDLSMGMSNDFEIAIEEGATWIRIGTALFGKRGSPWKPTE